MNASICFQFALLMGCVLLLTKPLGVYFVQVLDPDRGGKPFLELALGWFERLLYKIFGVDPKREQHWKQYAMAVLVFSGISMLFTYGILRMQGSLPFHGNLDALSNKTEMTPHLAFNTAASFMCNTDWQSYSGENTMSYFSQMVALTSQNFWSTTVGIVIAAVLVRGIARIKTGTIGNFWVDLVRVHLYLLLPVCVVFALFLVSRGMIQNFSPYVQATCIDQSAATPGSPAQQIIAQGPQASQVAIKMFGINGGGFFNANAAHPYENPNPLSNFIQVLSFLVIPSALTYYLGRMVKNQRHGWAVWAAMFIMYVAGIAICGWAESKGVTQATGTGVALGSGNMEGREVRFGVGNSAVFSSSMTAIACGAVNAMQDSSTPIGGMVPLFNMHLGEVVFGGAGAGLFGALVFVFVAIFIAGLMIGRTPEYLGKKIEAYDVKLAALALLVMTVFALAFTGWASISEWGTSSLANSGPHGFTEMLYAYSQAVANNGSAFGGLNANTPWWNTTLGVAILCGRWLLIVPVIALAGTLAMKKPVAVSKAGSFPVTGPTFVILLISVILIIGALSFFPALALGPIVEHFLMKAHQLF